MNRTAIVCTTIVTLGALGIAALIALGPLNPPAGAVGPTNKTLAEVEPRIAVNATNTPGDADSLFKITAPGSYYLTGNITGVIGKHGIEIAASGVTLDLNGFDLVGVPAMGAFDGVSATFLNSINIAVLNGSVRNWGAEGVDLASVSPIIGSCVVGIRASGNVGAGIDVGRGSTVSNCTAAVNGSYGINTSSGCTVTHCSAYDNAGAGFNIAAGGTVTDCAAYSNTGSGISTGTCSAVTSCTAYQNSGTGITTTACGMVTNCSAYLNTIHGINTGTGCTVSNCTVYQNTFVGIIVATGCTVADCSARNNTLDGITCSANCIIRGNTCTTNGVGAGDGAGIHVTSSGNRIEGNNCSGADRGIDVDIIGNFIIRNTSANNGTNWDIVANNVVGPIIDRTAPGSALINGNSAPDSTGSTHTNANFSY